MRLCFVLLVFFTAVATHGVFDVVAVRAEEAPTRETRDVFLMLDDGPLHLRIHISLGGRALARLREEYVDRLMRTLDANRDGKLTRGEADRSPLLRKKQRRSAQKFLKTLGVSQDVTRRDVMRTVQQVGGETVGYRQDMSSSQNDDALFKFLDADGSAVLDREEMLAAIRRILEKDGDNDEVVSFTELLPRPEPPPQPDPMTLVEPEIKTPTASRSTLLRDTRESLLPRWMIRRYDRNRDGRLSRREIGWDQERFNFLDTDRNGRLDTKELAYLEQSPLDAELAIDLEPSDPATPPVQVLSVNGQRIEVTKRPDFVKLKFRGAVVSLARRYVDPLAAARENAMNEFNRMDADGNGYLEKQETVQRVRFARGGFEMIDTDGDGKIFGEEMEEFVRLRGEADTTTCDVNLYDTGRGFFMALDANGDGRIGVREQREAARSLAQMERDGKQGLSAREPVRHFHIEVVRGSYKMFGPRSEFEPDTPAFQERAHVGPAWFTRMDRNGDGDVSWREFLGYRSDFDRLDQDNDGLIDPREAAAGDRLFGKNAKKSGER